MTEAVAQFRARVTAHGRCIAERRDTISAQFVVNRDLDAYAADGGPLPELVLVADNPGRHEWENGVYLCAAGRAGARAHAFFDGIFGPCSFRRAVMVLNKSSYHTPRTAGLAQVMRDGDGGARLAALLRDQEENGRLVAETVALLGIPVVTIGMESDVATFKPFRQALERRYAELGRPRASFMGKELEHPFRKVPHFSLSKIFCRNSDASWNAALNGFLERHAAAHPGLRTDKCNVSSKFLLSPESRHLLPEYLHLVVLGLDAAG